MQPTIVLLHHHHTHSCADPDRAALSTQILIAHVAISGTSGRSACTFFFEGSIEEGGHHALTTSRNFSSVSGGSNRSASGTENKAVGTLFADHQAPVRQEAWQSAP